MIETTCVRDELYYSDMAYALKKRFGMVKPRDINMITERRIMDRIHSISVTNEGITSDIISPFAIEVFSVVDEMCRRSGEAGNGFRGLEKHLDVVNEALEELGSKNTRVFQKK